MIKAEDKMKIDIKMKSAGESSGTAVNPVKAEDTIKIDAKTELVTSLPPKVLTSVRSLICKTKSNLEKEFSKKFSG